MRRCYLRHAAHLHAADEIAVPAFGKGCAPLAFEFGFCLYEVIKNERRSCDFVLCVERRKILAIGAFYLSVAGVEVGEVHAIEKVGAQLCAECLHEVGGFVDRAAGGIGSLFVDGEDDEALHHYAAPSREVALVACPAVDELTDLAIGEVDFLLREVARALVHPYAAMGGHLVIFYVWHGVGMFCKGLYPLLVKLRPVGAVAATATRAGAGNRRGVL